MIARTHAALPPVSLGTARASGRRTPHPGGAPANVATGIARLGPKSVFLGAIGKDDLGGQFMQLLQGELTSGGAHGLRLLPLGLRDGSSSCSRVS